ncbi:hypothetical protein DFH09DRAFT_1096811 [Mycena vulgaris]|nr:hypothetical protein DFH09DRAFT_1096811 [Mycena vulgaris]
MSRPIIPITLHIPGDTLLLRDPDSFPELPVYPNHTINCFAGVAYLNLGSHCDFSDRALFLVPVRSFRDSLFTSNGPNMPGLMCQFYTDLSYTFQLFDERANIDQGLAHVLSTEYDRDTIHVLGQLHSLVDFPPVLKRSFITKLLGLFSSYPSLVPVMPLPKVSKPLSQAQVDDILPIGKSICATKYDDRLEQRTFLGAKVLQLDAYSDHIPVIAEHAELADIPHLCRNLYHQSAAISGGANGGRYAIKLERERLKNKVLQEQQAHRAELEDARVAKEALESEVRASKEAARLAKEAAKKAKPKKKTRSSKVTVEDVEDEVSVVDEVNAQQATSASAVFDFIRNINNLCVGLESFQLSSISSDMAATVLLNPLTRLYWCVHFLSSEFFLTPNMFLCVPQTGLRQEKSRVVAEEFSPPSARKRARASGRFAHEDANEQIAGAEQSVNNDVVKNTVAVVYSAIASSPYKATFESLRLEESNVRSQLAYSNAQLRYHLDHQQYLLDSLHRILDEQHKR